MKPTGTTLSSPKVSLRELRTTDAESLYTLLTTERVGRFLAPPPATLDGWDKFIAWTANQVSMGRLHCFGIVPAGGDTSVGLIQVWREGGDWSTSEWGFAISERFWGTGLFMAGAELTLRFLFETAGVHRLEARTTVGNDRGNGALRKLGATKEALLRHGMSKNGVYFDQVLWSILADEWLWSRFAQDEITVNKLEIVREKPWAVLT